MVNILIKERVPKLTILFVWFIVYSFLGWIYETIYCSIDLGRYSERGFLFGPICPIYGGCIVLSILLFSEKLKKNISLFFSCALLASSVEYIVSFVMECIFHRRWWNYANQLFNINGRICLGAAIVFGLIGILIIRYFHPKLVCFLNENLNSGQLKTASRVIFTLFIFDLFVTIKIYL